jgi:hypothetical protein
MYFRNLTKYACSAPKSSTCHLVEFLPLVSFPVVLSRIAIDVAHQLPDEVKDVLSTVPYISKSGMAALHTHC